MKIQSGNQKQCLTKRTNVLFLLAILQINEYNIFTTQAGPKQWQTLLNSHASSQPEELILSDTKKRRDVEVYENYWKFTAAHLDITGTKFNNCLNIIVLFIDKNKTALEENAQSADDFKESELYK